VQPEHRRARKEKCRPSSAADQELRDKIAHSIIFAEAAAQGLREALAIVDERLDVERRHGHE